MLFAHYRELVTKEQAAAFWAIFSAPEPTQGEPAEAAPVPTRAAPALDKAA